MEIVADKLCWEGGEFKAELKKRGRVGSRLKSRGVFCLLYTCTDSEVPCLDETLFRHSSILLHSSGGTGYVDVDLSPYLGFRNSLWTGMISLVIS